MKTVAALVVGMAVVIATVPGRAGPSLGDGTVRCSKSALPRGQPSIQFLGTATADVLSASANGMRGATGSTTPRFSGSVSAQLFEVTRIGGVNIDEIPAGAREVLVVPWGYGPDCATLRWTRERWVEPGSSGLVFGILRTPEHWVDEIPTIDVHNSYNLPFPHPLRGGRSSLSADDAFTMISLLPSASDMQELGVDDLAPLHSWASSDSALWNDYPGRLLRSWLIQITTRQIRAVEPPMAGTYRMTLDIGDGRPRTFYARTESRPTTLHRLEEGDEWLRELRPPAAYGYSMLTAVAPMAEALPASRRDAPQTYMYAALAPDERADGSTSWRAGAELSMLRRALPTDTAVQRIAGQRPEDLSASIRDNLPPGANAIFTMHPEGRVTFEQRFRLNAERTATLRGERISPVTMPAPQ